MSKIFLGIGSGAVQLGLWAYYAHKAGFEIVLTRIDDTKIKNIYDNDQSYDVNIASNSGIKHETIGPVEIYNSLKQSDRKKIIDTISIANDIVTAVPSTDTYFSGGIVEFLKKGLSRRKTPVMIYASENTIGAGKILEKLVFPKGTPKNIKFSESVIGRMGGFQTDPELIKKLGLITVTPKDDQALLVEEFSEIVIEDNDLDDSATCFSDFIRTQNILMHEELKLYGHNAVHFLLGSLAKNRGLEYMSDLNATPDIKKIGLDALVSETGKWFKEKYRSANEKIATDDGFESWSTALIERITNPYLYDKVDRVARDPERKLRWDDRIVGIMHRCLENDIQPKNYALGVAAALINIYPELDNDARLNELQKLWGIDHDPSLINRNLDLILQAYRNEFFSTKAK